MMQGPPLTSGVVRQGAPKSLHLHACSYHHHISISQSCVYMGQVFHRIVSIHEIWSCLSSHDCENEDVKKVRWSTNSLEIGHGSNFCLIISPLYSHTVGLNLGNYCHLDCPVSKLKWLPTSANFWTYSCVSPGLTTTNMWVVVARKFPWRKMVLPNHRKVFW